MINSLNIKTFLGKRVMHLKCFKQGCSVHYIMNNAQKYCFENTFTLQMVSPWHLRMLIHSNKGVMGSDVNQSSYTHGYESEGNKGVSVWVTDH